jgi:hypothetical protein
MEFKVGDILKPIDDENSSLYKVLDISDEDIVRIRNLKYKDAYGFTIHKTSLERTTILASTVIRLLLRI